MKQLCVAAVLSSGLVVANAFADDLEDDYTVSTAGTMTFESPVAYGKLQNAVSSGAVVFDQSAYEKTEAYANSFTNFDAVANASTTFLGGWWDFGGGDFFSAAATLSGRTTVFDGAVVKNAGVYNLAGSDGTYNTTILTNEADLTVAKLSFGTKKNKAYEKFVLTGGSSLACLGDASMNYGSLRYDGAAGANYRTENVWDVSGTGTVLTVGGTTHIGGHLASDGYIGYAGGNTFTVTDGAHADLERLEVSTGGTHGMSNRVVFARGAKVDMTSFGYDNYNWTVNDRIGGNSVSILDGAVVTNTGTFGFGNDKVMNSQDELIISNATFYTESLQQLNGGSALFGGRNSRIVLSGPDAKFTVNKGITIVFIGTGNTFIVENGAKYAFPSRFSYTVASYNETLLIRSGAEVTSGQFACGNTYASTGSGTNNSVIVESGGKLTVDGFTLSGKQCKLVIDDGAVTVKNTGSFGAAGSGTNALVNICGHHPTLRVAWNMFVTCESELRFTLPAEGYDEGCATEAQPLIRCGTSSSEMKFCMDASSRIVFAGAEEMLAWHKEHHKRATYVLLESSGESMNCPDEVIAAAQAALPGEPGEMTLEKVSKGGNRHFLKLTVKPKYGMMLLVR